MPWYVFRCRQCGEEFTTLSAWNRKSEVICPKCGSTRLEEQVSQYRTSAAGGTQTGSWPGAGSSGCG
jgi:putative FmdB family regulatory protein